MTLPAEIYSFVVNEYLLSKGFLPEYMNTEYLKYKKDRQEVRIYRSAFKLPLKEVQIILQQLDCPIHEFKAFFQHFMQSKEFEEALKKFSLK